MSATALLGLGNLGLNALGTVGNLGMGFAPLLLEMQRGRQMQADPNLAYMRNQAMSDWQHGAGLPAQGYQPVPDMPLFGDFGQQIGQRVSQTHPILGSLIQGLGAQSQQPATQGASRVSGTKDQGGGAAPASQAVQRRGQTYDAAFDRYGRMGSSWDQGGQMGSLLNQMLANPESMGPGVQHSLIQGGIQSMDQNLGGARRQLGEQMGASGWGGSGLHDRAMMDLEAQRMQMGSDLRRNVGTQAAMQNFQDRMSTFGMGMQGQQAQQALLANLLNAQQNQMQQQMQLQQLAAAQAYAPHTGGGSLGAPMIQPQLMQSPFPSVQQQPQQSSGMGSMLPQMLGQMQGYFG